MYPARAPEKANCFTIAMTGLLIVVPASAATHSVGQLADVLPVVATLEDLPAPTLICGFTTVSTGSVVIAGLLVKTL